jgi:hypothetical protein
VRARARPTTLDELLGDEARGAEPHRAQHGEQRSERTEGRTLVHGVDEFSSYAPERSSTPLRVILPGRPGDRR